MIYRNRVVILSRTKNLSIHLATLEDFLLTEGTGATLVAQTYKLAGSPSQLRGICPSVSSYNTFNMSPPEWETPSRVPNKGMYEGYFISSLVSINKYSMPSFAIVHTS
jgi:hypothetical protein